MSSIHTDQAPVGRDAFKVSPIPETAENDGDMHHLGGDGKKAYSVPSSRRRQMSLIAAAEIRTPALYEWWALLCALHGEQNCKHKYMEELSAIMIVLSLVAGFTINLMHDQFLYQDFEDLSRAQLVYTISISISFSTSISMLFFAVLQYAQLNARMTSRSITRFFMDPTTSIYPLVTALLTFTSITTAFVSAMCYPFLQDTVDVNIQIAVLVYSLFIFLYVLVSFACMNIQILNEISVSIGELDSDKKRGGLYSWLKKHEFLDCYGEIVAQEIFEVEELWNIASLLTVGEFIGIFNLKSGRVIEMYSTLREYESVDYLTLSRRRIDTSGAGEASMGARLSVFDETSLGNGHHHPLRGPSDIADKSHDISSGQGLVHHRGSMIHDFPARTGSLSHSKDHKA